MARPIRIERAGGWYHITARGNERRPIYRDHRDRQHFCELLGEMVPRFHLRLHCFVLMENHYHLLLELREPNLSQAVQWLNVSYSVWFNRRHERSGHLFQGRFKSVTVSREEWALALSRYVHLNPVRVGKLGLSKSEQQRIRAGPSQAPDAGRVTERIGALRRYRWSSYRAYIGLGKNPAWLECGELLSSGGGEKAQERRNYRDYVESAVREGLHKSPWEELKEQAVLGSEGFLEGLRSYLSGDQREQRATKRLAVARPDLLRVIQCVEKVKGEKWEEFRDRHGDRGRDLVLYLGRTMCGLKLDELAREAGLKEYATVAMAVRRYETQRKRDATEQKRFKQVTELLNVKM
jgi:putative transposase